MQIFDLRSDRDRTRLKEDPYWDYFRPTVDQLLIVYGSGLDWIEPRMLAEVFEQSGEWAFALFYPWWPGVRRKQDEFKRRYSPVKDLKPELLSTSKTSLQYPISALEVRAAIGGHKAGTWLIGSGPLLMDEGQLRSAGLGGGQITTVAEELHGRFPCLLSLDEGDMTTLLLHLTDRTEKYAESLKSRIVPGRS